MELSGFSQEVQEEIEKAEEQRRQRGPLDYDACQRILEAAAEANSDALFGLGYYRFAEHYWEKGDVEQTMHCLEECTVCFRNSDRNDCLARTYHMMGTACGSGGSRFLALSHFHTGMEYAESCGDSYALALLCADIAYTLLCMKRYREAADNYDRAVREFGRADDPLYQEKERIRCLIECGFCRLILGQNGEALAIREQIQEALERCPDRDGIRFSLRAFEACCEMARGNHGRAGELANALVGDARQGDSTRELERMAVTVADYLDRKGYYFWLNQLIRILDDRKFEKGSAVYLDMYPYVSRYLLEENRTEEYLSYTRTYLKLYRQYLEDGNAMTGRLLELQEKLWSKEMEQRSIRESNQRLEEIALYDSLTNLPNRAYLNEYLSQRFEEASARCRPFGVELMDIDYFKEYNDTYGHLEGDVCIESVAGVLHGVENDNVFCARYGGDEFMIVYSDMSVHEIRMVAETIQRNIRNLEIPREDGGPVTRVTVSQGIFIRVPEEENREWDFNSAADVALYQAKQEGRNCYRISTEFV